MPGPVRGGGRKRPASAPPQRPPAAENNSAEPPQQQEPVEGEPATLDGELLPLPPGKNYDSADEDDGPTGEILEDADLLGVPEKAPLQQDTPAGGSPTREKTVFTKSKETAKELTKAQQQHAVDQAKWSPLKTDGSETRRFSRPAFLPYKDGTAPQGFVAGPQHEKGGPRPELRSKLTHETHPAVYVAHMGFDRSMFLQFQAATNEYAASKGAGSPDFWREGYRPFGVAEIMTGCGLLLRNGVSPVPQMALQFKDPRESFVFGDERVREVWRGEHCGGREKRWVQFRSFFHIQTPNPLEWKKAPFIPPGPAATGADEKEGRWNHLNFETRGPLYKCEPMLSHCRGKWTDGWRPGMHLSLDEETAGCKARCSLVTRIKTSQKKEGDGFQADAICEDGYTITFHFRCDDLPCAQQKDVSPRDTRCAWLAEQLPGAWYRLWMDNLYTSWKFGGMLAARLCLFGGTLRNEAWRGHHDAIIQKVVTKTAELEKAKGTLLASARAEGMPQGCEVICTSYYDDAPFMMMGNVVEGVEVIEIHRKCYSTGARKHFWTLIKRLSLADLYNHNMNSVDIADQLRMWYRPDGLWIKQKKWWWNIFIWCMGQAVVNAYLMYKAVCAEEKKKPMTHLAFHVAVATAWCKTPKIVLEYEKPTHAEARAAVAAAEPVQGGVRGERQEATRAAADVAAAELLAGQFAQPEQAQPEQAQPEAQAARVRREPGSSAPPVRSQAATKSPASGPNSGTPKMTDKKHEAAIKSYKESPELHAVGFEKEGSDCQICGTGRGMRVPGQRHQTAAFFSCSHCVINVCGVGCWKLLHGYYKDGEEREEKPKSFRGKKAEGGGD